MNALIQLNVAKTCTRKKGNAVAGVYDRNGNVVKDPSTVGHDGKVYNTGNTGGQNTPQSAFTPARSTLTQPTSTPSQFALAQVTPVVDPAVRRKARVGKPESDPQANQPKEKDKPKTRTA